MIPWLALLLSSRGRISRDVFWIGLVLAGAVAIALSLALALALPQGLARLIAVASFGFMLFNVLTKRLHDRDRSALWTLPLLLPLALAAISELSGLFADEGINAITVYFVLLALIGGGWTLFEAGFKGSDPGWNDYGHEPGRTPGPRPRFAVRSDVPRAQRKTVHPDPDPPERR